MKVDDFLPRSWPELLIAVVALAFLGAAITFFVTQRADAPPGQSSVDVGFLHDMITHHEQAITLSESQIVGGESADVQLFAREILLQQSREIGLMEAKLAEWGFLRQNRPDVAMEWMGMSFAPQEMPGMASKDELRALQDAVGEDNDALFLALMGDHHRGGVDMASSAAVAAGDSWVRDLAARMERNQAIEIDEMDAVRQRLGLPADPTGFESGPFPAMAGMSELNDG
ncbi:MAG: DUF305 domain-containing protein [Acidimicrobiia bacterium]|nr:DUF305 domain-containing protein [Acidimicrobiia bacterium]